MGMKREIVPPAIKGTVSNPRIISAVVSVSGRRKALPLPEFGEGDLVEVEVLTQFGVVRHSGIVKRLKGTGAEQAFDLDTRVHVGKAIDGKPLIRIVTNRVMKLSVLKSPKWKSPLFGNNETQVKTGKDWLVEKPKSKSTKASRVRKKK